MIKPDKTQLAAAAKKTLPDLLGPNLHVVFCGINPGLYSAAVGHHFARPGNRFWRALFEAGFTPRLFTGSDDRELIEHGIGLTNIVSRASAAAAELSSDELRSGAAALRKKLAIHRPRFLAVVGFGAFRTAFEKPDARAGLQPERLGATEVWLLPNPSGLNTNHQPPELKRLYEQLRLAAKLPRAR